MNIIEEYLVSLGLKDNLTDKLASTLQNGSQKVSGFVGRWGKQWALAGGAVVSGLAAGSMGIAKFIGNLVKTSDELDQMARYSRFSRDELFKTRSALDAMGKSLAEVRANPLLYRQFVELRKEAEQLKPPDMREGLNQAREISFEFTKLKQVGGAAIQWVGFYLLKYIEKPMQQVREKLGGITEKVSASMPVWTQKIGQVLSWMVRLGMALIRGASRVYTAIQRVFDMIPRNVKIAMAALAAFGMFIRAGPVGRLITILSAALLLLEDFFTYLDGGDALLGGVWKALLETLEKTKKHLSDLYEKFRNSGSIEAFLSLLTNLYALFTALLIPIKSLGSKLLSAFTGSGQKALDWFITTGLPKLLRFVSDTIRKAANLIEKLNNLGATEPIIIGLISAFAGLKIIDGISDSVNKLNGFIAGIAEAKAAVGHLKNLQSSFGGLRSAVSLLYKAKIKDKAETLYLMALYAKDAVVKGASTAATIAHTAATTAWNVVAGIGAAVTTAFGAAVAFLTSPIGLVILAIVALIAIVVLLVKNWEKVKEFFIGLWTKIQEKFSNIGPWFSEKFTAARDAVMNAFRNIGEWFKEKALQILSAIASIPVKAREKLSEAAKFLKKIFTDLPSTMIEVGKNLIKAIWTGITHMGSWLKDKVTGFFSGIWNGAKNIFGGGDEPTDPSNSPVGKGPDFPGHADGGLFNREHVARFAEKNQPEAVLPLTKPERTAEILQQATQFFGSKAAGTDTSKLLSQMESFLTKAEGLLTKMNGLIQPGTSTISNTNSSIVNNNQTYDMKSTYNIYDSSGNPQSTAKAVDRQQQLRIRNMQGVLM